ncbi:aldo/keto reductase, partial [Methylobacterium frigidaeris]
DRATVEAAAPRGAGLPGEAAPAGGARPAGDKRLDGANPFGDSLFTPRNWDIVAALRQVAEALGQPPARVALAWVMGRPGVASTLMGVSRPDQVTDNVAALSLVLPPEHRATLDAASAPTEPRLIYALSRPALRSQVVFGGAQVSGMAAVPG